MKFFCFIFSFYLLLLSWQPCQDLAAKDSFCPSGEIGQSHLHDDAQDEKTDDCSPFCSCSCCQVSTSDARLSFAVNSRYTIFTQKPADSFYHNDYSQQPLDSIWQPPKFVFTA